MNMKSYGLRDYLRLLAPLFGLIAAVLVLRIVLAAAGAPWALVRACSVTVFSAVSVLMAVLLIHIRRFGAYSNVIVAAFLLEFWEHLLIAAVIAFSAFSGIHTVFSAPEYSPGRLIDPWRHIRGHLTFGIVFGSIFGSGMGCLFLWMLRKLVPSEAGK